MTRRDLPGMDVCRAWPDGVESWHYRGRDMYTLETVAGVIILIAASYALGWTSAVRNYRGQLARALHGDDADNG